MLRTSELHGYYGEPNPTGLSRLAEFSDWTFAVHHEAAQEIADKARCYFGEAVEFHVAGGCVYYRPCTGDWPRRVNDYVSGARDLYTSPTTGETT